MAQIIECPNGCGRPYHPIWGHHGRGWEVTRDEVHCLAHVRVRATV